MPAILDKRPWDIKCKKSKTAMCLNTFGQNCAINSCSYAVHGVPVESSK